VVVDALKRMGIQVERPKATFYVWAGVPEGVDKSKDWCLKVLDEIAVWMIPGSMYGAHGEGFFRIALTHPVERLQDAMERLGNYL
jgi:LL-diaminopimelate aminotransferase